jgi:hypothetical protein
MKRIIRWSATLVVIALPGIVLGHHSRSEFADETTEIEGVLTDVIWRNPHIALFLNVVNENGEEESWRIETFGAPRSFEDSGVSEDLFRIGDRLTVAGRVSTRRSYPYILGTNALLANGTEAILGGIYEPYWDGPYVGGASEYTEENAQVVNATAEDLGIFRVWSNPGRTIEGGVERYVDYPFTDEAVAARAEWDTIDNPITRCEQPGMPVPVTQPVHFRIIEEGQDIVFHYAFFDTLRTIHMDQDLRPEAYPPSHLGFSKGVWENDSTLVIETTRINYPYVSTNGTIQSDAVEVFERYTLSDDQTRLDIYMTVDDPVAFTRTATYRWHFLALGQPFSRYVCNVF